MIDPTFGEIVFRHDAWDGLVSIGPLEFTVHIWSDSKGPSTAQRVAFDDLKAGYEGLWPSIASELLKCHEGLISIKEIEESLSTTVNCYVEGGDGHGIELVYAFDLPGEGDRGYFIRLVNLAIVDVAVED